eukprot:scaffold46788_cov18-Tisochrysis_lutea.AAC.1
MRCTQIKGIPRISSSDHASFNLLGCHGYLQPLTRHIWQRSGFRCVAVLGLHAEITLHTPSCLDTLACGLLLWIARIGLLLALMDCTLGL